MWFTLSFGLDIKILASASQHWLWPRPSGLGLEAKIFASSNLDAKVLASTSASGSKAEAVARTSRPRPKLKPRLRPLERGRYFGLDAKSLLTLL